MLVIGKDSWTTWNMNKMFNTAKWGKITSSKKYIWPNQTTLIPESGFLVTSNKIYSYLLKYPSG